jgi:probable F420-dependent oxidoreductase
MRIGAVFPQTEMPADRGQIRAYVEAVRDLGFDHLVAYDHVLGAYPPAHPEGPRLKPVPTANGWEGAYTYQTTFHEPFVLFGYVAALSDLELVTGVLVLPQRQTALVAKQAAEVDVLTGGRTRLGVGIGWNGVEYDGLGKTFEDRGRRLEEQVRLLRALWTDEVVTFEGEYEQVVGAGINPLPVQRPIPLWIGARDSGPGLRRAGRVADGWFALVRPGPRLESALEVLHTAAREAGRDPADLGMEGRINVGTLDLDQIAAEASGWRDQAATHVSLNTMNAGLVGVDDHVAALAAAFDVVQATASTAG